MLVFSNPPSLKKASEDKAVDSVMNAEVTRYFEISIIGCHLRKNRSFFMKNKTQKKEELKKLKEKLPKSTITVFTTFSRAGEKGLSVAQMSELKKVLRAIDAELFVTKKTLMDLALRQYVDISKYPGLDIYGMDGSVGLVLGGGEGYAISKKLYEFAKKNKALQFFGAIFENNFIGKDGFLEMAKMPSRETLLARLFGMMKYPISGLAIVLSEVAKLKPEA